MGVSRAWYEPGAKTLQVGLIQVGSSPALRSAVPQEVTLDVEHVGLRVHVEVDGAALGEGDYSCGIDGTLRFSVLVAPARETRCTIISV